MSPIRPASTLQELIRFASVSSSSNVAVTQRIAEYLDSLGFVIESTEYRDPAGERKQNLVARRDPDCRDPDQRHSGSIGGLAYFCHTDVVPVTQWTGPGDGGFAGVIADDRVYGRGACDMKGSLVSMLAAASRVRCKDQKAALWIVCTADEEVGFEGASHVVNHSAAYREIVAAQPLSIIGEPTGLRVVHAHKGIVGFSVTSTGRAAHSSTDDGVNANDAIVPVLELLLKIARQTRSDQALQDQRFDPPHLSWNFGVSDGCAAVNITPDRSVAWCSLRTMPDINGESLIGQFAEFAQSHGLEFRRFKGGKPVWIDPDAPCIVELCKLAGGTPITVCYGTDAGEFTELNQRVILGPGHIAQAHTTDEYISLAQLEQGADLYADLIRRWCH